MVYSIFVQTLLRMLPKQGGALFRKIACHKATSRDRQLMNILLTLIDRNCRVAIGCELPVSQVGHMLFVPDIFALERTNGIE